MYTFGLLTNIYYSPYPFLFLAQKRKGVQPSAATCSSSQHVPSQDVFIIDDEPTAVPPVKKKLDFGNEPVAKSPPPNPVDDMSHDAELAQLFNDFGDSKLANVLDMSLDDFYISGPAGDFPQPFPATICEVVPTVETALDVLCSSGRYCISHHHFFLSWLVRCHILI